MMMIQVFDPPMCCSTGVCGPAVDPQLLRFASDLRWLANHGVQIERYNLSQHPQAFAACAVVRMVLAAEGNSCLPLLLVNGVVAAKGEYPSRENLAWLAGLTQESVAEAGEEPKSRSLPVIRG